MSEVSAKLGKQSKAVASGLVAALFQLQVYVGQGGWDAVGSLSVGQWIGVVLAVLGSYGLVYAIPNADDKVSVVLDAASRDSLKDIAPGDLAKIIAVLTDQKPPKDGWGDPKMPWNAHPNTAKE